MALGISDVDGMLNSMSSSQYVEWQNFLAEEPQLSATLVDRHFAQMLSMYYNRHRASSAETLDAADFCLLSINRPEPQSAEQMYKLMQGIQSVQNSRSDFQAQSEC